MATAIERNFDTMGYRMYFAKIPKFSQQEKETRMCAVLKEMLQEEDNQDFFLNATFLKRLPSETLCYLWDTTSLEKLQEQCQNFIPNAVCQLFQDYVPMQPTDEGFIGVVTKELLKQYLEDLHQEQIDWYTEQYQLCEEQPDIALEKIQRHYIYQRCTWETSKEFMTKKSTPFAVTDNICYFVYQIHQLYQTIDFEKEELLIYGW